MSVKGKGQYYGTFRPAVSGTAGIIRCQMDGVDLRGASKATCIGKGDSEMGSAQVYKNERKDYNVSFLKLG
ncbi:hypothetical protein E2C01_095337 [Portunus trituberculatus]|uniref:Uncharacterized protein n=1 Tax=Portunus trituberculatus TaxID=210409 RepID=A0A5B7JUZ8_PORTR|nr:hypothetical protein [Portunus trituberculatus]